MTDKYTKKVFLVGEKACSDNIRDIAITRDTYIQICPAAFSFALLDLPETTIGSQNTVDWSAEAYSGRGEQSLEHWAKALSYIMFHEMSHLLLECKLRLDYPVPLLLTVSDDDYYLHTAVQWMGGTTNKAYRYHGAVQLVAEDLDAVINNVDNLGMLALCEFQPTFNPFTAIVTFEK